MEFETYVGIALSIIAIATIGYNVAAGKFKGEKKVTDKITSLETRLNEYAVRQDVIWKIFEQELPKLLIRPTHKELDAKIIKVVNKEATKEEAKELLDELKKEVEDESTDPLWKFKAACYLPVLEHNLERW